MVRTHRVRGTAARLSPAQDRDTRVQGAGVGGKGVCERGREGQLVEIDLPAGQAGVCTTLPHGGSWTLQGSHAAGPARGREEIRVGGDVTSRHPKTLWQGTVQS